MSSFKLKTDARNYKELMERREGGNWTMEHPQPGHWIVFCSKTRSQIEQENRIRQANNILDQEYCYWSNKYFGLNSQKESNQRTIDKFKEDFEKDPAYTLKWSNDVLQAAANLTVIKEMQYHHDRGVSDENICTTLEEEAKRKTESLSRSTSVMSNLMEDAERVAYSRFATNLRSSIESRYQAAITLSDDCYQ